MDGQPSVSGSHSILTAISGNASGFLAPFARASLSPFIFFKERNQEREREKKRRKREIEKFYFSLSLVISLKREIKREREREEEEEEERTNISKQTNDIIELLFYNTIFCVDI